MLDYDSFKSVSYVIDQEGRKSAVQVDMHTWAALLQYLEDLEDRAIVKAKIASLKKGPELSGSISWEKARREW